MFRAANCFTIFIPAATKSWKRTVGNYDTNKYFGLHWPSSGSWLTATFFVNHLHEDGVAHVYKLLSLEVVHVLE